MVNEYKKIVLLNGLEAIQDYEFRLIKSLLTKDLKLTRKMQDDYDRIRIADLMEEKFQNDAGLRKLIALCRDIPALADLAETLEKRRLKGNQEAPLTPILSAFSPTFTRSLTYASNSTTQQSPDSSDASNSTTQQSPDSSDAPNRTTQQSPDSSDAPNSTTQQSPDSSDAPNRTTQQSPDSSDAPNSTTQQSPDSSDAPNRTTQQLTTIPKEASKECGYQKGPKEVMVLKATESFTYEFKECEKRMFHATVATESQFFRVKVFDISLKDKFIPRKVIAISDYIGRNGFLEIYSASSVSDVSANRKMEISYRLVQIANGTPKIEYLCSQCTVKYMSVNYLLQKNVREDCTYYEIQDNTGRMEVVVYGRLTYINCEEGDKLKLFCFELAFNADKWQLRSVFHSYIKTLPKRGNMNEASKECGYQKGPKEVMVLKATESFTYEFKECEKRMFHATVATESQFFRVKVFDISLKDKFIPRKVIAISDYIGRNGFLEIYSASSVSDVSANRKMEISYRLVQIANGTPKIEYLCSQCTVKYVNGVYTVYKVSHNCTYYEIQDNTGKMEVVVHGRLIYINCEEGDKLKLFCFELAFNEDKWQLRSVKHSYIKVGILRECLSSKGLLVFLNFLFVLFSYT
uniref:Uncharacterized protein n=1 Tax=Sciurus vulgaris TaxID=55149 RepID=A0A8D2AYM1_SCIVU